jgi:hypothetical protein
MSEPRSNPHSDESKQAGSSMRSDARKKEAEKKLREEFQRLGRVERDRMHPLTTLLDRSMFQPGTNCGVNTKGGGKPCASGHCWHC